MDIKSYLITALQLLKDHQVSSHIRPMQFLHSLITKNIWRIGQKIIFNKSLSTESFALLMHAHHALYNLFQKVFTQIPMMTLFQVIAQVVTKTQN